MRRLLSIPSVYSAFQDRLAVRDARAFVMERYGKVQRGDRVLDVGCGPADVLRYLPEVEYIGIDHSATYLPAARHRYRDYPGRATFIQMDVNALDSAWEGRFDVVLALGLLHHLSNQQAVSLLTTIARLLHSTGRLVTTDPAFTDHQHWIARLLLHADRGRFVRHVDGYRALASTVFPRTDVHVHHDLLRLPYTHAIMECHGASPAR